MTDSNARVRQTPQIRASDGQKATLNIGDRVPYATGSFQPGVGTVGVSPLVQTQFNFVDTGVNVEITPYVHSGEEVTLHVDVNVSTIRDRIDLGGVSQPIIGQRKAVADIRLRDGEVTILGGLTQIQDSSSSNGIPGLVNIPVLGKFLFGSQSTNKERGQLLIALIPHIVRTPNYTPENLREIGAGNDSTVKLSHGPRASQQPATPPPAPPPASSPAGSQSIVPVGVPGASVAAPSDVPKPAASPSSTPPGVPIPPMAVQPAPPTAAGTQPQSTPPLSGAARVTFLPGALQAQLSGVVAVNVQLENVNDLFAITSLKLKFDPAVLKLNDVTPGEMIQREGGRVTSVKEIHNDTGEVLLTVTRLSGSTGVNGSGSIATLNFTAVGKGSSRLQVTELAMKNSKELPLAATLSELPVTVQ
jgi:general secretion pathway protein D